MTQAVSAWSEAEASGQEAKLAGQTFVLTGTLESQSREEAKRAIESLGWEGHIVGQQGRPGMSSPAKILGSKLAKAEQLVCPLSVKKSFGHLYGGVVARESTTHDVGLRTHDSRL